MSVPGAGRSGIGFRLHSTSCLGREKALPGMETSRRIFYDRLEALPVGALPVRPPTGKYTYFLNRAPGIGIRVDLRGVIVVEHQNKTMRYKFQSDEDIGQTFLLAAEMANYWEENPPQKARRSSVEDSLQVEDGFASSSDGEASS